MPAGGCNTLNEVQHILINPPLIFTMQLIWESNAENAGEIRATMDAIQEVGCLHIIIWQCPLQCSCQGKHARAYTLLALPGPLICHSHPQSCLWPCWQC